jgi:hypothetical protein
MVDLTTLAPDVVDAILDESLPSEVTLFELAVGTPLLWGGSGREFGQKVRLMNSGLNCEWKCHKVK